MHTQNFTPSLQPKYPFMGQCHNLTKNTPHLKAQCNGKKSSISAFFLGGSKKKHGKAQNQNGRDVLGDLSKIATPITIIGGLLTIYARFEMRFDTLDAVNADFKGRFEGINTRFEGIDKRFESIDKRFENIDKRFENIDKRFENIDKRFENIDKRFDKVESMILSNREAIFTTRKEIDKTIIDVLLGRKKG